MKSTRSDVERLLGRPSDKYSGIYFLKDVSVDIEYARFPCGHKNPPGWPEAPPGWNVPADTVVAIRVSLRNKPVSLASLTFDLSNFKRVPGDSDVPQHFYYANSDEGFALECFDYDDGKGEMVGAYVYTPTAKEEEMFRCKE